MNTFPLTNEQQKIEELKKPRFEVIADYPKSEFKIGDIIEMTEKTDYFSEPGEKEDWAARLDGGFYGIQSFAPYPHLFKPLQWWEKRSVEEMPEYVKEEKYGVFKVIRWEGLNSESLGPWCIMENDFDNDFRFHFYQYDLIPATSAEYTAYINIKK